MADAPPRLRSLVMLALLAGCAGGQGARWWPQTTSPGGAPAPAAVWGPPETEADAGLFCNGNAVTLWLAADAPLSPGRLVPISAGSATMMLTERFVMEGNGAAEFDIPLASPLNDAIAGGARELRFGWPEGPGRLPLGRLPRRAVQDCRATPR